MALQAAERQAAEVEAKQEVRVKHRRLHFGRMSSGQLGGAESLRDRPPRELVGGVYAKPSAGVRPSAASICCNRLRVWPGTQRMWREGVVGSV